MTFAGTPAASELSGTKQIKVLQDLLDFLHYKMWYFKTALEAGTEKIHFTTSPEGERVAPNIHEQYRAALAQCYDIKELIDYQRDYDNKRDKC